MIEVLSLQERTCLDLLVTGMGNRDIAQAMGVSTHMVEKHLIAITNKLSSSLAYRNRTALAVVWIIVKLGASVNGQ